MRVDQYVNYENGTKRCNGALHNGKYIPLNRFSKNGSKARPGSYYSQCRDCLSFRKFGPGPHGWVPYERVNFIFDELENRLGRMEACRRMKVSINFYCRKDKGTYKRVRISIVKRAMLVLLDCRWNNEVRHKDSIKHGATQRGRPEKVPTSSREFYNKNINRENGYKTTIKNIEKELTVLD